MKFSCYKSDLNEALQFVIRAVDVKPAVPVLSGIYINAHDAVVELQANNLSTGIITRIPASVEENGVATVGGKRFQEFARNMPDDTLTVSLENNLLRIQSGGADVNLLTMNAEDFPKVQPPDVDKSFEIEAAKFKNLIRKTSFAAGKDDTRPIFTGVNLMLNGNNLSAVATDTHRLAFATDNLKDFYDACSVVVPVEPLKNIMAQISPANENVKINFNSRYISFQFDNYFVTARLIEGIFPPHDKVIPKEFTTKISVNTKEFFRAVNFVAVMSKEAEYKQINFDISEHGIEILSNSPEIGDATQTADCQFDGEPISIAFNVQYIIDALRVVDSDKIQIGFNDRFAPAQITEPDNPNFIYVVTPVRTR